MLKLHFAPNSRAGRIVWLLEELGLPHEINKMAFHPRDLKSDEHRARHPLGRVPVLEDGDVSIFESGAIVDYIMEHLKPKGRAGIIVPEGVIFQTGTAYKTLRKRLVESSLVGVISLPAGVFNPYSGVKTSILILDKEHNL